MAQHRLATFWTGPASPYQALCLRSWVAHGFEVDIYTIDTDIELPRGVRQRPARDILDLDGQVHRYKEGYGAGSPSLHSNLFRYKLLERGGWWLDTDVLLLRDVLPGSEWFLAWQKDRRVGSAVMHFPAGSGLAGMAITEVEAMIETAQWGQTGPHLVTRLVNELGMSRQIAPKNTAYDIDYSEVLAFFDPASKEEVEARVATSTFVHLWHEVWRAAGIPEAFAPPEGSYLDAMFQRYGGAERFKARLPVESIRLWLRNEEHARKFEEFRWAIDNPLIPVGPRF